MTIADKLLALDAIKTDIAVAIESQGVTVGGIPFDDYAAKIALIEGGAPAPAPWVRQTDWLELPILTDLDHKFVGLHAVYPQGSNFCALSSAGDYTVDWGDGAIEDYAADVVAYHEYDYASISPLTDCSRGYRQVVVQVYPQAGQSFTTLNLHQKHNKAGLQRYASGFLDIAIAGANLTALLIGAQTTSAGTLIRFANLEQAAIYANSVANLGFIFNSCYALMSLPILQTSSCSGFNGVFYECCSLRTIPDIDTANGTVFTNMFYNCRALQSIPALNTALGASFNNMFTACCSLRSVPELNTTSGTNFASMFSSCYALESIPLLDTSSGTNFSGMFSGCTSINSIPLLDTAMGTDFSSMFTSCRILRSIPLLNTATGTILADMFNGCYSLQTIPLLNTAANTNFFSMFSNCFSLQSVPAIVVSGSTSGYSSIFNACNSLSKIEAIGFNYTFSVSGCKLDAAALDLLYSNLLTVSGQTITVSNNHGNNADTPSIATAKGWTVTG